MVRITLYDPQISAEVYSRRRAAEQPFESPVAEGLGQLGRALTAREERREPGHQDKTKAMKVLGRMRKEEFARLKKEGGFSDLRERWSAKGYVLEYVSRRDETLADLAKKNPRAARIVAEKSATLTEDLSRRAMVMEANNTGQSLVADINASVGDAIETVRADPTQLGTVLSEFRETLTGLAENGMDSDATATIVGAAERKITNAAFRQRLKEDPAAAKEELAAGEFGDALAPEEAEAFRQQADRNIGIQRRREDLNAQLSEAGYRAEFDSYTQRLQIGDVDEDEPFSEELIRARVSPEDFERYYSPRLNEAAAIGVAFAEIEFLSDTEIHREIAFAEPSRAEALASAQGLRNRLRDEDPAAYALRNDSVRELRNSWMRARAEGDFAAARNFGGNYAAETLRLQGIMGVAESDLRVLPADMADAMVANFTDRNGKGPVAWGQALKTEFGEENWRIAVADVVRAGLPEGPALFARMQADDQRPAAEQLWAEFDTRTEDLRGALGPAGDEIAREHAALLNDVQSWPGTEPIDPESAQGRQSLRRAYLLGRDGVPPSAAVRQALVEMTLTPGQYAWVKGPAERIGDQEARAIERSGGLAFVMGVDAGALRSGGDAANRLLQEISRMDQTDHGGRERLLLEILGLGASSPAGMELLDAFDRQSQGRPSAVPGAAVDGADLGASGSSGSSMLEQEFEEFRNLSAIEQIAVVSRRVTARGVRPQTPFLNDPAGALTFVEDALLSGDPLRQRFGAMVASDVALAAPSFLSRNTPDANAHPSDEARAAEMAAGDPVSGGDESSRHDAPALASILQQLTPEALSTYDRLINELFQSQAPMDIGPDRVSDRFTVEYARELAQDSDWPEGEEQIVEFALLVNRSSEANDRQFNALIERMHLTLTPRDPELAKQLVAAAHARRVPPGTALRTPSDGVVLESGGLENISAQAVPFLSGEELVLSWLALQPTRDPLPDFDAVPPPPPDFLSQLQGADQVIRMFKDIRGAVNARSRIALARQALRSATRLFELHEETERDDLIYLIRVAIHVRQFEDDEARNELDELREMHKDVINFENDQATDAADRPPTPGVHPDTRVR